MSLAINDSMRLFYMHVCFSLNDFSSLVVHVEVEKMVIHHFLQLIFKNLLKIFPIFVQVEVEEIIIYHFLQLIFKNLLKISPLLVHVEVEEMVIHHFL